MDNVFDVRVLGPFEVTADGVAVNVGGRKRGELVALLALQAGRVVAVERLAEGLWGSRRPTNARNAVQHHVTRLRRDLGPTTIASAPDGYALRGAAVDALLFTRRLEQARVALRAGDARGAAAAADDALQLWRGPALLGFLDSEWASAEAARLEALRVDALEARFEAALALGDHATVLPEIRGAVTEHPFRERLWGQLMLALYRGGRQADALDAFQDARRMLSEQLGLEPGPELRRVQAAILVHDTVVDGTPGVRRQPGNLPAPVTSFVGRHELLVTVRRLLLDRRLVTLLGPPGAGKSRVALELARSSEPDFPDGAWLVDLAHAGRTGDVGRAVASAVGASEPASEQDVTACIVERVRDAAALLVLDGCEHVLLEARAVVAAILAGCPRVRVLATSREALRLQGEARADVGPFELPCGASATARELASSDAVQLFADRARDARPGFALTAQSAVVIADICRRLDGLALPIERAAGRLRVMGLEDLRRRLDAGVATLVRADRPSLDALAPLMTLIDWSYELLNEDEKLLLRQLAVFRGGSPLPAAVAVGAREGLDETTVTDVLQALVDKSVVRASFPNDHPRYDVLETVREYALAALARSGGLSATRSAHAEFFATMAHGAGRSLRESEHLTWLRRLEPEHGNLWAALSYARAEADAELAVRLGAGLGWYFALANLHAEGRSFLEQALSVPTTAPASPERVAAHAELCHLADLQLDRGAAIDAGNRGLALAHGLTAPRESALVRTALALALINGGRRRRAAALLREARADFEAVDDDWGVVGCELVAAVDAMNTDNAVAGAALSERILKRAGATGYLPYLVWGLLLEGWSAQRRGDGAVATRAHRRALDAAHELGLPHYVAFALAELGARACADGDLVRAELLQRRAVSIADRAQVGWFDAHARVRLAATLVRKGEPDAARALYRVVVDRTQQPRDRHAREAFFAALAGSPAAAAVKGLAELS